MLVINQENVEEKERKTEGGKTRGRCKSGQCRYAGCAVNMLRIDRGELDTAGIMARLGKSKTVSCEKPRSPRMKPRRDIEFVIEFW